MTKIYELTDSFTGQSFGYIHRVTSLKLARKYAQNKANEVGYEISLHQIKSGKRYLIDKYNPKGEQ